MSRENVYHVVSFGDVVADVVLDIPQLPVEAAAHQIVRRVQLEPGGACNFMIAGERLGMHMTALGVVGEDLFGPAVMKILKEEGISVDQLIVQPDGTTTTVFVLADPHGKHVFLGQNGIGPVVGLSQEWRKAIAGADALQSWGYSLKEERLAQTVLDGLAYARMEGRMVFFDPGPQMEGVSADVRQTVLSHISALLLTEDEIPLVTGGEGGEDALRRLLNDHLQLICLKLGPRGCKVFTEQETTGHAGFEVQVRDTSAAGDSFDAAFIYAVLHGWGMENSAIFANAMGAAKVQKFGSGRQVPQAEEVRRLLLKAGNPMDF